MKLFSTMYDKVMLWSKHRYALAGLSFVSFIEAIFFPIPPDIMLIPMSISQPNKAMRYAIYATAFSIVGGIIGYCIGFYASDWVQQTVAHFGYQGHFERAMSWFEQWGIAIIFLAAGFSPVPFKVFTLCAGVLQMAFLPFILTATISRFARFVLVAKLSAWGGEKYADKIRRSIELIGWATLIIVVIAYLIYRFLN